MNILLINHYAGSPKLGMEYRPYYMARQWARSGHETTILTADFTHLRLSNPMVMEDFQEQKIDSIRYSFVKTPTYSENDGKRMKNISTFARKIHKHAAVIAEKYKPRVVICSSTSPFDIYGGRKIAALSGAKFIFEVHDLWPLTQIELYGYKRSDPRIIFTQLAFDTAVKSSDAVVSILPHVDRYLAKRKLNPKQYVYIPNGIVTTPAPPERPAQKHIDFLHRYREKGMFLVLYGGSITPSNALETFLQAAGEVDNQEVLFILVGNGAYKINLKRYAKLHHLNNVLFLDAVNKDQMQGILTLADCLYIGTFDSPLYEYGVSMNKIFDYMLSKRPIVYAVKASNNPIEEAKCGLTVAPQNPQAIADAIVKLKAMDEKERQKMGENGYRYVCSHHDYSVLADDFLSLMLSLAEEKNEPDIVTP